MWRGTGKLDSQSQSQLSHHRQVVRGSLWSPLDTGYQAVLYQNSLLTPLWWGVYSGLVVRAQNIWSISASPHLSQLSNQEYSWLCPDNPFSSGGFSAPSPSHSPQFLAGPQQGGTPLFTATAAGDAPCLKVTQLLLTFLC